MTGFQHDALLYGDLDAFSLSVGAFVGEGLRASEPVMLALPQAKLDALGDSPADGVRSVPMEKLGANPGRIIPEVLDWVSGLDGRRCRFVGEPLWPGRTGAETVEVIRHEALINLAFADAEMQMLCPYDTSSLGSCVLADSERVHPGLVQGERRRTSSHYADPLELWRAAERQLSEPEQPVMTLEITDDLAEMRIALSAWAGEASLARLRTADLVLAVNEAATNSLLHGSPPVRLRAWVAAGRAVCEVSDGGQLTEPLAGRMRPSLDAESGRGVWLINQLCDLVELRPGRSGTTIRMQVRLEA